MFLKQARREATAILPEAIKNYGRLVRASGRVLDQLEADPKADALPAIRALPAMLNPFLERVIPKKTESSTQAMVVHVHLTPGQQQGLDAPVFVVEAEEVKQLPAET